MKPELTEAELIFITDLATSYQAKRNAQLAKATRKSPSAAIETATLSSLISKLEAMQSPSAPSEVEP